VSSLNALVLEATREFVVSDHAVVPYLNVEAVAHGRGGGARPPQAVRQDRGHFEDEAAKKGEAAVFPF
jgi:hypothetical protein